MGKLREVAHQHSGIIALLDPDAAGRQGRAALEAAFGSACLHAFVIEASATRPTKCADSTLFHPLLRHKQFTRKTAVWHSASSGSDCSCPLAGIMKSEMWVWSTARLMPSERHCSLPDPPNLIGRSSVATISCSGGCSRQWADPLGRTERHNAVVLWDYHWAWPLATQNSSWPS